MENYLKCPGGCNLGVKKKFKKKKNIDIKNLNLNCTNNNHEKPDLYECKNCKLIYSEFVETSFLSKYKDVNDEKYISQIEYKKNYFKGLFNKIENEIDKSGNSLEIGSYYGVFSNIAKKSIKNFYSLELSKYARDYSQKEFGIHPINEDPLVYLGDKENFFDCILMFDVIEHLDNPFELMQKLNFSLKKNGKLIFTTFDMNALLPKIMGRKYHWIIPMHKYYFSFDTLNLYLKKNNLRIYKTLNDDRTISFEYLFYKLKILFPSFKSLINLLSKNKYLINKNIKINFYDLKIFFVEKI